MFVLLPERRGRGGPRGMNRGGPDRGRGGPMMRGGHGGNDRFHPYGPPHGGPGGGERGFPPHPDMPPRRDPYQRLMRFGEIHVI